MSVPGKAVTNFRKYGVSFADAELVFSDPLAIHRDDPDSEDEARFIAVGQGSLGKILVVVYTWHGSDISLSRRVTRHPER